MIKGYFSNPGDLLVDSSWRVHEENGIILYLMGHIYNINTDAPAAFLLSQYLKRGDDIFKSLDGAFTIVLFSTNSTVIIRDRHGLGEQVYYTNQLFCTSLYTLVNEKTNTFSPNYDALAFFLFAGYISSPCTSFREIHKLEAGHMLVFNDGQIRVCDLFPISDFVLENTNSSLDEYADVFSRLHKEAILRRVNGASKINLLLSGGYDSGANLVALREMYAGDIYTYSVGFKNNKTISELSQSRLMSREFSTIHTDYEMDGCEIKSLPEIIRYLGDPFAECGMMLNYCAMKMINSVPSDVILGGEGNDNYFSTGNKQIAMHYLMVKYGVKSIVEFFKKFLDQEIFDKDNLAFRLNFYLGAAIDVIQGEMFGFPEYKIESLLEKNNLKQLSQFIKPDNRSYEKLYMQHIFLTDIQKKLNKIILFKSSKMALMFNHNISFPFVDLELYKFIKKLPIEYKCKGNNILSIALGKGTPKYLHKYVYASKMPKAISGKAEQGGFVPMNIFFEDNKQRERMIDIILSSSVCGNFLNRITIERFLKQFNDEIHKPAKWFWYKQIKCNQFFNILSLAIWWEEFVKGKNVDI